MLRNYILIAWRNLWKDRLFSAINVTGLALAVFACLTIYLYVSHELSFDAFHTQGEDIYRVNMATKWGEDEGKRGSTPPPIAGVLMREIPEVQTATRIYPTPNEVVFLDEETFKDERILATDTNFFDVFSFPLIQGSVKNALALPNSAILTEEIARKYFPDMNRAMGQTLLIGKDKTPFKVTGIIRKAPSTAHFQFDILTSIQSYKSVQFFEWSWIWTQLVTYVRLKPGTDPEKLNAKLSHFADSHIAYTFDRIGFTYKSFKAGDNYWKIYLQPLQSIWLHSTEEGNDLGSLGNLFFVYVFSCIGLFILVLACINFINLSTARATGRAKEVGIRKTLGTSRWQLVSQFLIESLLICVPAVLIGFTLAQVFSQRINGIGDNSFGLHEIGWVQLIGLSVVFVGLLSVWAGLYPAFYLSSFDAIKGLKGHLKSGKPARLFRNGLVVFQFAISTALILISLVIHKQLQLLKEKDLGFTSQGLVVIENVDQLGKQQDYFKAQLLRLPGVSQVSFSAYTFPNFYRFTDTYKPTNARLSEISLTSMVADHDFIRTLGLQLSAGRNFLKNNAADKQAVIINEMAARQIGWKDPLGKEIQYPGEKATYRVVGVIKDFHQVPINFPMEPLAIFLPESGHPDNDQQYFLIQLNGPAASTLAAIEQLWKQTSGNWPFQYAFVNDGFRGAYQSYEDMQQLFVVFCGLAILISCLGLLGLAIFATHTRTKEISIRKVLGASVSQIVLMLNREFTVLIGMAFVLGGLVGYVFVEQWLQNFEYRTQVSAWEFVVAAVLMLWVALVTVSYLSFKTALSNPVKSLRSE